MTLRTFLLVLAVAPGPLALGAPTVVRATPDTLPAHVQVEITAIGCDTKKLVPAAEVIWYATVKAKVGELKGEPTSVAVQLRDPKTDAFLLNPGARETVEGDYLVSSISFSPAILDQILFQWREGDTIYEIYLRDFYSGERC